MLPKMNLPTLPQPMTRSALQNASSNQGSVPANPQPDDADGQCRVDEAELEAAQHLALS
ncbi:hypothetical protein QJS10_CPA16g00664 [Acorus calamus]|uniref:Uncharacterized protein n=1 Tax=Acorus calamus TaxID=4465 RepID=A0AAV9D5I9_ACOCL|nr:hypothetical protein QJS10_CPA16g00664 [Acorus calamus]